MKNIKDKLYSFFYRRKRKALEEEIRKRTVESENDLDYHEQNFNKKLNYVEYEKNVMKIGDKEIVFKEDIYELVETEDKVFVLLKLILNKSNYTYDDCHNLYCYTNTGERLWQIGKGLGKDNSSYTLMRYKNSNLYVTNFEGVNYKVNVETGELSKPICVK